MSLSAIGAFVAPGEDPVQPPRVVKAAVVDHGTGAVVNIVAVADLSEAMQDPEANRELIAKHQWQPPEGHRLIVLDGYFRNVAIGDTWNAELGQFIAPPPPPPPAPEGPEVIAGGDEVRVL